VGAQTNDKVNEICLPPPLFLHRVCVSYIHHGITYSRRIKLGLFRGLNDIKAGAIDFGE